MTVVIFNKAMITIDIENALRLKIKPQVRLLVIMYKEWYSIHVIISGDCIALQLTQMEHPNDFCPYIYGSLDLSQINYVVVP